MDSGALVERLFARFVALYGSQKVGAMWADADVAEVKAVWARKLSQYHPQSIKGALDRLMDSGREWPPTLPEFAELCRQSALGRAQQVPALLAPRTDQETARRKVAEMIAALAKKCETPTR
jgi:hypothetical protein